MPNQTPEPSNPTDPSQPIDPTDIAERLAAAAAFIERNFRSEGTLRDVARAAHLSPFHFHRLFRSQYGMTPRQMREQFRIREVQRLLLEGKSTTEASRVTGFSHVSHMGTRFKRIIGTTPLRWLAAARAVQAKPVFVTPDVDPPSDAAHDAPITQRAMRILLVEDDPDGREILLRLLRGAGHEVHEAADAPSALAVTDTQGPPDVVLSDLGLPGMDGCELMKILHTRHGTPGIALTGFGDELHRTRCQKAGFGRFLTKPANLADVLSAIAAIGPAVRGTDQPRRRDR